MARCANQRDWLSAVLATTGDAVIALNADGRVSYLNPAARALTGWSLEDGVGLPAADVLRLLDSQSQAPLSDLDRSGQSRACLLQARDNTRTPIDQRATPMHDSRGAVAGTLVVFRDRSECCERLRTEANLRESEAAASDTWPMRPQS